MPCGVHFCGKPCQPPHGHDTCKQMVTFTFDDCQHIAKKQCFQDVHSIPCKFPCKINMKCLVHPCGKNCKPAHTHDFCTERVDFSCQQCGKQNDRMCSQSESEIKCEGEVIFQFSSCSHTGRKLCHENAASKKCKVPCLKPLPCEHPCSLTCGEECNAAACRTCKRIKEIELEKQKKQLAELKSKALVAINKELEELKKQPITDECIQMELSSSGDTAAEYFNIEDMVKKYIQPDHRWFPEIKKIIKLTNIKLFATYLECKKDLFDPCNEVDKFHGTSKEAVNAIIKDGFKLPSKAGLYGKGVYFASDSSKSAQEIYTKGSNMLLLCKIALGRTYTVEGGQQSMTLEKLTKRKYDSLFAKRDTRETGWCKVRRICYLSAESSYSKVHNSLRSCQNGLDLEQSISPSSGKFLHMPSFETKARI